MSAAARRVLPAISRRYYYHANTVIANTNLTAAAAVDTSKNHGLLSEAQKSHGRAYVLHETLKGFVQRKDITTLAAFLPPSVVKEEIVVTVRPSRKQRALNKQLWKEAK